jgi:hypothetical protein
MIYRILIIFVLMLAVSCRSVETGKTRTTDNGDTQVQVSYEFIGVPILFIKTWQKKVSEWFKMVEQVKMPLVVSQWALLVMFLGNAVACMYVSAPVLQKRFFRASVACGVAYLATVAIFISASFLLGHPWWIACVLSLIAAVGCWLFWEKEHGCS